MSSKRLVLLRHAKSSWADPAIADHDRPLNARGRRAASLMGQYLQQRGVRPDLVLCSSTTRARQTLELLEIDANASLIVEDELYGSDAEGLLARLRAVPPTFDTVLLVGHNPSIEELARTLLGEETVLGQKYPTGAAADLRLPIGTWDDLRPGVAQLREFVSPRELG